MSFLKDQAIYPVLAELSACLCNALGEAVPCFCGITAGPDLPAEYIGECEGGDEGGCGVAYVRVVTSYPTENFPEPLQRATVNSVMAYSLAVGVLRCTDIGQEDGAPPTPETFKAESIIALADMKAIRQAIQCCLVAAFPEVDHVLGSYEFISRETGVFGGEWPVTVLERF